MEWTQVSCQIVIGAFMSFKAKIEMIVDSLGDFYEKMFEANFVERDEQKKAELKKKVWQLIPVRLGQIEKILAESQSGYAVGE